MRSSKNMQKRKKCDSSLEDILAGLTLLFKKMPPVSLYASLRVCVSVCVAPYDTYLFYIISQACSQIWRKSLKLKYPKTECQLIFFVIF